MKIRRITRVVFGFILLAGSWPIPGLALAEMSMQKEGQSLQKGEEEFCENLNPIPEFVKICLMLELYDLSKIIDLKSYEPRNLLEEVRRANDIMVTPEKFAKLTKGDPEVLVRKLGFLSVKQLSEAKCGPVLVVKQVGLKRLSEYEGKIDEVQDGPLDEKFRMVIVPLDEGKSADSIVLLEEEKSADSLSSLAFSLRKTSPEWHWTRRGSPKLIRMIQKRQREIKKNYKQSAREIIEVQGLNLRFLGLREGAQLRLISLTEIKIGSLDLVPQKPKAASEVWAALAIEAKKIIKDNDDLRTRIGVSRAPVR